MKHESKEDAYGYVCLECGGYFNDKDHPESWCCPRCGNSDTVTMDEYLENNRYESTQSDNDE